MTVKTDSDFIPVEDRIIQIAIMGRPNVRLIATDVHIQRVALTLDAQVGKSTILNSILGEDRVITGPTAGLTRDSIQVEWEYNDRSFKLCDTAGLTRIRSNKENLKPDRKRSTAVNKVGYEKIILPGVRAFHAKDKVMLPDEDPSQFSYQISEMALVNTLNTLRFSQIVLLVVENSQGVFSKIDLQLAKKCLEEGRALVVAGKSTALSFMCYRG